MNFEIEVSKKGYDTLKVNGIYIYSKYDPYNSAKQFITNEKSYINENLPIVLFGLGLGYHLEILKNLFPKHPITVVYFDERELDYCNNRNLFSENIIMKSFFEENFSLNTKKQNIIIPLEWIKAYEKDKRIEELAEFKLKQTSFRRYEQLMQTNFEENIVNSHLNINQVKINKKIGFLIGAGPSLEVQFDVIKKYKDSAFVISVGAAFKPLLLHNIKPDAIVTSDPSEVTVKQIQNTDFDGYLFYLATANKDFVKYHQNSKKVILFQEGFELCEIYAKQQDLPLLNTGGSVATVGVEVFEKLGFKTVYLFGVDLAFKDENTHVLSSTSNSKTLGNLLEVVSNSGQKVKTTNGLNSFRKWFEKKALQTEMEIFNMSIDGAKIKNIPYVNMEHFEKQMKES